MAAAVVLLAISVVRVAVLRFGYQPAIDRVHNAQQAQADADRAMTQMQAGVQAFQLSHDPGELAAYTGGLDTYSPAAARVAANLQQLPAALRQWSAANTLAIDWQRSYAAKAIAAAKATGGRPVAVSLHAGETSFDRWRAARAVAAASLAQAARSNQEGEDNFRVGSGVLLAMALGVLLLALIRRQRRPGDLQAAQAQPRGASGTRWPQLLGEGGEGSAMDSMAVSITRAAQEISGATVAHLWLATEDGELRRVDPGHPVIVAQRRRHDVALRAHREGAITTTVTRSRRLVAVPLLHEGRTRGVVELTMPSGASEPTSAQTELLRAWGRQAAKAIAYGPGAGRDPLTGFEGRPHLLADVAAAVEVSVASGAPVSLVVLRVDHIDRHAAMGATNHDELIRTVGAVLSDTVRTSDTAYRVDDEMFAVLLPGATAHAASSLAERLRQIVARRFVERGVTASFGVATCPDTANDDHQLVEAAESALYDAQRFGGNRTQSARPLFDELALSQRLATDLS